MSVTHIGTHRELIVWQKGMRLFVDSWRLARRLPAPERFDLASQIRRSSLSIPSNIAEGKGRDYLGDYLRHLSIAKGSAFELDSQLLGIRVLVPSLAREATRLVQLDAEVSRMLFELSRQLRTRTDLRRARFTQKR